MVEKFLKFVDVGIEKKKSHFSKKAIDIINVDIKKTLISNVFVYDKNKEVDAKCFRGYKTSKRVWPIFIELPQRTRFLNKFEKSQYISFVIRD